MKPLLLLLLSSAAAAAQAGSGARQTSTAPSPWRGAIFAVAGKLPTSGELPAPLRELRGQWFGVMSGPAYYPTRSEHLSAAYDAQLLVRRLEAAGLRPDELEKLMSLGETEEGRRLRDEALAKVAQAAEGAEADARAEVAALRERIAALQGSPDDLAALAQLKEQLGPARARHLESALGRDGFAKLAEPALKDLDAKISVARELKILATIHSAADLSIQPTEAERKHPEAAHMLRSLSPENTWEGALTRVGGALPDGDLPIALRRLKQAAAGWALAPAASDGSRPLRYETGPLAKHAAALGLVSPLRVSNLMTLNETEEGRTLKAGALAALPHAARAASAEVRRDFDALVAKAKSLSEADPKHVLEMLPLREKLRHDRRWPDYLENYQAELDAAVSELDRKMALARERRTLTQLKGPKPVPPLDMKLDAKP